MAKKLFSIVTLLLAFSSFAERGNYFKYNVLEDLEKKGKIFRCSTARNSELPRCPSASEKDKTITCFLYTKEWRCPNPEKSLSDNYLKGLDVPKGLVTHKKSYSVSLGYYQIPKYWEN